METEPARTTLRFVGAAQAGDDCLGDLFGVAKYGIINDEGLHGEFSFNERVDYLCSIANSAIHDAFSPLDTE